jgi:hypothetical protein
MPIIKQQPIFDPLDGHFSGILYELRRAEMSRIQRIAVAENLPWSFLKIKSVDFFPAFSSWLDFHFLDTSAIQSRSAVFSRSPLG